MYETKAKEHRVQLGEAIKVRRKEQRLSQNRLAEMVNSGQSDIYRIEAGKVSVGIDKLVRIAEALDVPVNKLIPF